MRDGLLLTHTTGGSGTSGTRSTTSSSGMFVGFFFYFEAFEYEVAEILQTALLDHQTAGTCQAVNESQSVSQLVSVPGVSECMSVYSK